jgi:hypothetical protein
MMNPGEALRRQRLEKKRNWYLQKENLLHFARDLCGYDRLMDHFHGPICEWLASVANELYVFWSAARGHYKTTLQIADVAQDLLRDPTQTHLWVHNTLSQAEKAAKELAWHFQHNEKIRELWPEHCASPKVKFFKSASQDGTATFQLVSRVGTRSGQPSFTACSIHKDVTGMHISGSVRMDDLISADTINESGGLQYVSDYWGHTVIPVMDPGCKARNTGTRWDAADLYGKWIASEDWNTLVRAVLEDADGRPDWKGQNVGVISDEELEFRRREMGALFGPQMMNDPAPMSERIWNESKCEHPFLRARASRWCWATPPRTTSARRASRRSRNVEISPRTIGLGVLCVFVATEAGRRLSCWTARTRRSGTRTRALMRAFGLPASGELGSREWKVRAVSAVHTSEPGITPASVVESGAVSSPQVFLKKFFEQVRVYRKTAPGKNNLQHDDVVDVVGYATDPALDKIAPQPEAMYDDDDYDEIADLLDGPQYGTYI